MNEQWTVGPSPLSFAKYPDCKTWTVFDNERTLASRIPDEATAQRIVQACNSYADLLVRVCCGAVRDAEGVFVKPDSLTALLTVLNRAQFLIDCIDDGQVEIRWTDKDILCPNEIANCDALREALAEANAIVLRLKP